MAQPTPQLSRDMSGMICAKSFIDACWQYEMGTNIKCSWDKEQGYMCPSPAGLKHVHECYDVDDGKDDVCVLSKEEKLYTCAENQE